MDQKQIVDMKDYEKDALNKDVINCGEKPTCLRVG